MFLERIEMVGFRGINRLSLQLDDNTVLIGENSWGKSSLLDALRLILSPAQELYRFQVSDFYHPPGEETAKERHLHIVLTFCEHTVGHWSADKYQLFSPVCTLGVDNLHRIHFRLEGEWCEDGSVATWRNFIDAAGRSIHVANIDVLIRQLIRLHPVLRLRDARQVRHRAQELTENGVPLEGFSEITDRLAHSLSECPENITNREIREGLEAARQLLEHYFAIHDSAPLPQKRRRIPDLTQHNSWQSLEILRGLAKRPENRNIRLLFLGMFASLLHSRGIDALAPEARPLLIIEDPETRLHPIMLSVAWGVLSELPLQRLTTTNSGELLSYVPVERICRLVRNSNKVSAYRVFPGMLSREDSRRIAFHICFNRAASLFARSWLLVEGETEVWLLTQLASLSGYHFHSEGIKIIEFAQCGLKPLIKFARGMGIEWHVLTDGDDAGKKYAATVRGALRNNDTERERLTFLPVSDMEMYLYREGFASVFHQVAQIPQGIPMSPRRVIDKAIHKSSKPDLALAIVEAAEQRGADSVPRLLRQMFSRVVWLSRGRAG